MKLDFQTYKDKVAGCWMGKNIGGTLGAPFEGKRAVFDIDFYTEDIRQNPPANDDLDLQLLWLNAVERYGRAVNASILGEYWLSFIIPDWAEYGAAKANLRNGFAPPLSGYIGNPYRDSCGSFIRSELWACLAPGNPEIAVQYAYEDAIVDHSEEGVYGEVFWAAVQSAAFVESDKMKLIEIGLSYIPETCGVARGVRLALEAYQRGDTWQEARRKVLNGVPGTFGVLGQPKDEMEKDIAIGEPGWDAPSNIGITIIGWLYGEDDFGKSLCTAVNCGEDTDCTAATLGATLGIIHGRSALPEKWTEPIGDVITTKCINDLSRTIFIPATVTELTERILRLTPLFLGSDLVDILAPGGYTIETKDPDDLMCRKEHRYVTGLYHAGVPKNPEKIWDLLTLGPFVQSFEFPAFKLRLDYGKEPFFTDQDLFKLKVTLGSNDYFNHPLWLDLEWHLPEGVSVQKRRCSVYLPTYNMGDVVEEFDLSFEGFAGDRVEGVLDIRVRGRHSRGLVPVLLMRGHASFNRPAP